MANTKKKIEDRKAWPITVNVIKAVRDKLDAMSISQGRSKADIVSELIMRGSAS